MTDPMQRFPRSWLLALAIVGGAASAADAHCCHDDREFRTAAQSTFGTGAAGAGDRYGGLGNGERDRHPPSSRRRLGSGARTNRGGGLGQLRGNSLGAYGAGSPGERGPGGLGALGAPPPKPTRPR